MIKLYTFDDFASISEKFINWFPHDETKNPAGMEAEYKDVLKFMIDLSYEPEGGYMDGKYDIDKDIIDDCMLIKIYKSKGVPCAFRCYKDKLGRKAVCSGTNGTKDGKDGLYKIFSEDIKFLRSWSEVNAKLEHIFCSKYGAERVPSAIAKELIKKNIKLIPGDDYHYDRLIGDVWHTKCIITGSNTEIIKKLKEIDESNDYIS